MDIRLLWNILELKNQMNIELLIKLTNQAVEKYITLDPANAIPPYHIKYNRILAELIVGECANAIVNDSRLSDVRTARNGCVRTIKEHFGIQDE